MGVKKNTGDYGSSTSIAMRIQGLSRFNLHRFFKRYTLHPRTLRKCGVYAVFLLAFLTFLPFLPLQTAFATMENYCVVPPYVKRDVSVNIMVMLDNSTDMENPAYGSTYTPNATKDNYYGYFDPLGCYNPNISSRFQRVSAVNYTTNPVTGCDDVGKTLYNGNILNWATMSGFSVAKKVISGGKYTSVPVPQFILEGADWAVRTEAGCSWNVDGSGTNIKLIVTEKDPLKLECAYLKNSTGWPLTIRQTTESTTGVLQEFSDINPVDNNFDPTSPRFGITVFTNTTVNISQYIPPNNYENFHNDIKTMTSSARNNDLATAHKTILDYFDNESPTSGTDPYKSCASWENPCMSPAPCRKSSLLMLTTGIDVTGTAVTSLPSECSATETRPLVKNACYAYNTDLRSAADLPGKQNISTYVVHTFGSTTNQTVLQDAAIQGGGNYYSAGTDNLAAKLRQALQDIIKRAAAGTAASVLASGEGSGANLIQAVFYPRAMTIPKGGIFGSEVDWIGRLTNYWYYVDPFFAASSIYEDNASNKKLNLTDDNKIELYFDPASEQTKARRYYDANDDGVPETYIDDGDIEFEKLSSIWEAGVELWKRTSARTIYMPCITDTTCVSGTMAYFSKTNASASATFRSYLQAADLTEAEKIIDYTHGYSIAGYRSRTVAVDLNNDGDTLDTVNGVSEIAKVWKLADVLNSTPKISSWLPLNTYHQKYSDATYGSGTTGGYINTADYKGRGMVFAGANDGMLHAFKLGTLDVKRSGYEKAALCADSNADLQCSDTEITATTDLGKEAWAFIPKNTLPYLRYLTDSGYCHIYSIDLTPYLFDASINKPAACTETNYWDCAKTVDSWRTILIGGMRYGGACKPKNVTCSTDTPNSVCAPAEVGGTSVGYSSYFALDITDQNNPTLLWEFSNPQLGFTTAGPAIVRIGADTTKNGKWFVVLGSGPTGPISITDQQFLGRSDQNMRLFVLDLKTGSLLRTIDTTIANAFAGSMLNTTIDPNSNYQDDVVYIPYVKKPTTGTTWTDGGIGRLVTKEDLNPANWAWSVVMDGIGPVTSSVANLINKSRGQLWLYFGSGRYYFEQVATTDDAIGQRQIFGIKEPCYSLAAGFMPDCTTSRSFCTTPTTSNPCGDLTNVTDIANVPSDPTAAGYYGWYINLDPAVSTASPNTYTNCDEEGTTTCAAGEYGYCEGNPASVVCRAYRAERIITDPMTTTTGLAFFTAYKPYEDECTFGGKSAIWATKYDTGGAPGALLKGIALVQVSTGAIEQIDLSTVFTQAGGRKSTALEGVPPTAQGLSLVSTPPPVKRVLHIRER